MTIDSLKAGREMIEAMMKEAQKRTPVGETGITFEDKLKVMDRWMKFKQLELARKAGSMGSGFDAGGDDEPGDL